MKHLLALLLLLASPAHAGLKAVAKPGASTVTGAGLDNATSATTTGGQWLTRTGTGSWTALNAIDVLGECHLLDYDPAFASKGTTAKTQSLQNAMLDCQKKAIDLGATFKANLALSSCLRFRTTGLSQFGATINSPVVIPRYVCWDGDVTLVRDGSAGTPLANWNGDTSTRQLSNVYQPAVIVPPNGIVSGTLRIIANSNGSDRGSGFMYGKTWRMGSLAIQAAGTGFAGGETCSVANGDTLAPAAKASFTCASASGGACTAITFSPTQFQSATGQYYLPPFLQRQQYQVSGSCAAASSSSGRNECWDGHDSLHPQVFDNDTNKYYKTTCSGSGTGLTVSAKFWPDWCTGSAADSDSVSCSANTGGPNATNGYDGLFGNFSASVGRINQLYVEQSGHAFSATYGYTYGAFLNGFELTADYVQTQLSHYGLMVYGSDVVVGHHNDVGSAVQLKVRGGGSLHVMEAREDTPTDPLNGDAHAVEIDKCANCAVTGTFFHNSNSAADVAGNYIRLGSDAGISDASHENAAVRLSGVVYSDGTSGSNVTALGCAYTRGTTVDLTVSNVGTGGSARAHQFTKFVAFGSNCETGVTLRGSIDNVSDPVYSGTLPALGWYVTNAKTAAKVFACQVVAQGGTGWTNTGIGTSEVNLVSVPLPPMGANDKLEIDTLWTAGGTATNTHNAVVRLGTSGCTPQSACSNGSALMNANMNSSSLVTMQRTIHAWNQNATNAQVVFGSGSTSGIGNSSSAVTTTAIQTNGTLFLNIDGTTATSSADSVRLEGYTVKRCNGGS